MHILGQEAMVPQKEAAVAVGHAGRGPTRYSGRGWRGSSRITGRSAAVGGPAGTPETAAGYTATTEGRCRRCCYGCR